jgi:hypothetical protein
MQPYSCNHVEKFYHRVLPRTRPEAASGITGLRHSENMAPDTTVPTAVNEILRVKHVPDHICDRLQTEVKATTRQGLLQLLGRDDPVAGLIHTVEPLHTSPPH